MAPQISIPGPGKKPPKVHLIDGTGTQQSYGVVARRGTIFLGIKFSGLLDGARFGLPGTTYLHARLRSAGAVKLVALLDSVGDKDKIFDLCMHQLSFESAWPNLSFEKVDAERASLEVGLFIQGSLIAETEAVIVRVENGDLFRKLIAYVISRVGVEHCIIDAHTMSHWLAGQAKPMLHEMKKRLAAEKVMRAAQQEFKSVFGNQMEVADQHSQQLDAFYKKHMRFHPILLKDGKNPDES
jgi:hypothetical protein